MRKLPFKVSKVLVIPGNFFSHPVPSVAKLPKAPIDTKPCGWHPELVIKTRPTEDIGTFWVKVGRFMKINREIIAKVFPEFHPSEALTSMF